VSIPPAAAALGTGDFTISYWLKKEPGSIFADLIGNRGSQLGHGNFVFFSADHHDLTFEVDEDGTGKGYIFLLTSGAGVDDGAWHKITGVRAGAAASLYIDGVLAASGTASDGFTANLLAGYDFTVGASNYGRLNSWIDCNCSFDDVRIYRRALSPSEILAGVDFFNVSWGLSTDTPINKRP
jgi:hypothetical protein